MLFIILTVLFAVWAVVSFFVIKKLMRIVSEFEDGLSGLYVALKDKESQLNEVTKDSLFFDSDESKRIVSVIRSMGTTIDGFFRNKAEELGIELQDGE